jgi:hypothetical protein
MSKPSKSLKGESVKTKLSTGVHHDLSNSDWCFTDLCTVRCQDPGANQPQEIEPASVLSSGSYTLVFTTVEGENFKFDKRKYSVKVGGEKQEDIHRQVTPKLACGTVSAFRGNKHCSKFSSWYELHTYSFFFFVGMNFIPPLFNFDLGMNFIPTFF